MIPNYIRPQLKIKQLVDKIPSTAEAELNAFVYGPQFNLHRYTDSASRKTMEGTVLDAELASIPFEGHLVGNPLDHEYTRLFVENGELELAGFVTPDVQAGGPVDADVFRLAASDKLDEIILKAGTFSVGYSTIASTVPVRGAYASDVLDGRDVQVGDQLVVSNKTEGKVYRRRVMAIKKSQVSSEVATPVSHTVNEVINNTSGQETINGYEYYQLNDTDDFTSLVDFTDPQVSVLYRKGVYDAKLAEVGSVKDNNLSERFTILFSDATSATVVSESGRLNTVATSVAPHGTGTKVQIDSLGLVVRISGGTAPKPGDSVAFTATPEWFHSNLSASGNPQNEYIISVNGTYSGKKNTTITVAVAVGGKTNTEWVISDSAGEHPVTPATTTELAEGVLYGNTGLFFTLTEATSGIYVDGDNVTFECTAAGNLGDESILVLNAPVFNNDRRIDVSTVDLDVWVRTIYTGEIPRKGAYAPLYQWESTDEGVVLPEDFEGELNILRLEFAEPTFCKFATEHTLKETRLFVHYRELVPSKPGEKIHRVANTAALDEFGENHPDNPLGAGASAALSGSNGRAIYVARVRSDDIEGFTEVLTKAENLDSLYAHAPMTENHSIQTRVRDHVELMSNSTNKRWRRAYFGCTIPDDYPVIAAVDGVEARGTISNDGSGNVFFIDENRDFVAAGIRSGDLLRINFSSDVWGDDTFDKLSEGGYVIDRVVDDHTIILAAGPDDPVAVPKKYEIWKNNTSDNIVLTTSARSRSFGSRRVVNVVVDGALGADLVTPVKSIYVAAEIAGLRAASLPQQGLTNTELKTVASAPLMYIKYNQEQLDSIASNGSMIVTQEYENGAVFIRHQLTTDSGNGILYYEDSIGVNLDDVSFKIKALLRKYIGQRNVNERTLSDIYTDGISVFEDLTGDIGVGSNIGPQLLGFKDYTVSVHPTVKDRIDFYATLQMPVPLNNLDVTLHATTGMDNVGLSMGEVEITGLSDIQFDNTGNPVSTGYQV
jgi:hypothetical protein